MLPPNPADLATSNAAALAEEAGRVFQYLARVATAAANLAEQYADDADHLAACAPEGDDRDQAEEYARQAAECADWAARYAARAERDPLAGSQGILATAAEDIEPAALAEVAAAIARAMSAALVGVAEHGS